MQRGGTSGETLLTPLFTFLDRRKAVDSDSIIRFSVIEWSFSHEIEEASKGFYHMDI